MLSALKKLARNSDDRCPAPVPMSSSLQKKFSRGVHFNMKILIKGDRNVGKSCLLQRLQGGPFIEDYAPTDQIQVAPINWTYKNTDYIVKVEVWEVVDKGRTKKKPPLGLKLENQSTPATTEDGYETPILDATFLDVYKNASGVILMLDITKPWTFDYVVKELSQVPADLPVVVLGNHCDMQHHRQVHLHHIQQTLHQAKLTRTAPVRYAESSMRNGFGLRLLHKFLSIPFLRLQKTSLLEQLQRNQKDMEEIEKELDDFQNSEESHYNSFVDRLANKRRQSSSETMTRPCNEHSPSIVLGAGKPIIPPNVNPLLAQSLNPPKSATSPAEKPSHQTSFVSPELTKVKYSVSAELTPSHLQQDSVHSTPSCTNTSTISGGLDEFYAGTLDSSFLEDLTPITQISQDCVYESDSDDDNTANPKVTVYKDDLDIEGTPPVGSTLTSLRLQSVEHNNLEQTVQGEDNSNMSVTCNESNGSGEITTRAGSDSPVLTVDRNRNFHLPLDDFPLWAGDTSARRSPEGGEDPDVVKEIVEEKGEKKHKKKKSKDKDKGDYSDKSERKEKKKHKKSKNEKRASNPQQDLLAPTESAQLCYDYEDYDSI
ncbi:hypothetical protein ACJJTC_010037 [Scirpophaga incertulas]